MEELLKTTAFHALKFQHVGGVWNSGGLGRFQQADLGSQLLGPPAVYITGIAHALELPSLTSSEEGYLLSALKAILEANQRHFKEEYGYWGDLLYREPAGGGEWPAGFEGRSIGAFHDVLDALDRTHPPALPPPEAIVVSPTSGQHTSGSLTYQFKLVVHGGTTQLLLQEALEHRTRLMRWEGDNPLEWSRIDYDTDPSGGNITVTAYNYTANPPNVEFYLTQSVQAPGDEERFKYVLVTWDSDLRWHQDTTVQEN